jgi:FkbM family methyltransferase
MKFFYGTTGHQYIDITNKVLSDCLKNNKIYIPSDDITRAGIFGDPLPGILKNIMIIFNDDKTKVFYHTMQINLELINNEFKEIITENIIEKTRKDWWQNTGKFIKYPEQKLNEIHKYITIKHGNKNDEYPEQLMAINFINENDVVLEIGANIGRNTCIIAQILKDDTNLVTLESNLQHVGELIDNRTTNGFNFQIESSALSKRGLIQKGWITLVSDIVPEDYFKVNTITWNELNNKYNLNFNTLVADCEGALYYILQDEPDMLANFNKIIIENDFTDESHKDFVHDNFIKQGFRVVYSQAGGWGPCYNFFFQVWQK